MLKKINPNYIILALSVILFVPFLGNVHLFDWDEINFAESAREMIVTNDYLTVQINFEAFWEKPPLFIWMQVLSMKIFGINEFAARFPNAICGIITLLVIFNIGKKLYNKRLATIWTFVYAASLLPHFYFKSGIIDPWFNLFIFLSIYYFFLFADTEKNKLLYVFLSATFSGLGVLTKGPVAFLLFFLTAFIYMIIKKQYKQFLRFKVIITYAITIAFVGGFWFLLEIINGNYNIIEQFIEYQIRLFKIEDAGHGGFLLYHFVVLFFGVFPASVFAIKGMFKSKKTNNGSDHFRSWMKIIFWVVIILFSIVNTKIIHYSSMCYFPITFLAAYSIENIFTEKQKFNVLMKTILIIIATILGLGLVGMQWFVANTDKIIASGIIKDDFANANFKAQVYWSGFEFLIGLVLILGVTLSITLTKNTKKQIIGIFLSSLIFINLSMTCIVPRVEKYTQNTAIEFYKSISKEDCYLTTFGFKSYAIYYYFNKQMPKNSNYNNLNWLLRSSEIDKNVYVVCKNTSEKHFEEKYPEFKKIESKNGFAFFKREKHKKEN